LKVFSGPPNILFSWRHWAKFSGSYCGNAGKGQIINMFGLLRLTVNESLKVERAEVFFDPDTFIECLEGNLDLAEQQSTGQDIIGDISTSAIIKLQKQLDEGSDHDKKERLRD
jgi:hypothetical protein